MATEQKAVPPDAWAKLQARMLAEQERVDAFGEVRPIVSVVSDGYRLVGVGHTVHYNKASRWRTFHDFLLYFLPRTFGHAWGAEELTKPLLERHVVLQWYEAFRQMQQRSQPTVQDGLREGVPDGPSFAYLLLGYDLYLLGDHGALRERFVERLKHPSEFQGARYELFVAATLVRAGFDLTLENERDGSRKHPEFLATHRRIGEVIAVEAKSRRLPGVLGFPGERVTEEDFQLDVRQLVRRAFEKQFTHPYVVFLDANMPPTYAATRRGEWVANVNQAVAAADTLFDDVGMRVGSLFNEVVVTNVPDHYGEAGGPQPEPVFYTLIASEQRRAMTRRLLEDIERALGQSHRVPMTFLNDEG